MVHLLLRLLPIIAPSQLPIKSLAVMMGVKRFYRTVEQCRKPSKLRGLVRKVQFLRFNVGLFFPAPPTLPRCAPCNYSTPISAQTIITGMVSIVSPDISCPVFDSVTKEQQQGKPFYDLHIPDTHTHTPTHHKDHVVVMMGRAFVIAVKYFYLIINELLGRLL